MRFFPPVFIAFVCAPFAFGFQDDAGRPLITVRGDILTTDSSVGHWTVELIPQSGVRQQAAPANDGSFDFHNVPPGRAEVRVTTAGGAMRYDDFLILRGEDRLAIRVGSDAPPRESKGQAVTIQELMHKVPRKAQAEFDKGLSAIQKRRYEEAAAHYRAALEIDPGFVAAHNDLGVTYLRMKDYARSLEQVQAAVDLAPGYQPATDNLCLLLIQAKRYEEAGAAATAALKRGGGTAATHYATAVSLIAQGRTGYEVLEHLNRAKDELPRVRLLAASVLASIGRRAEAAGELETFLRTDVATTERPQVEEWLAGLKQ